MLHSREFRIHREGGRDTLWRQIRIARRFFTITGIEREDRAARQGKVMCGFRQFNAPAFSMMT
jgi:hypothetical protein